MGKKTIKELIKELGLEAEFEKFGGKYHGGSDFAKFVNEIDKTFRMLLEHFLIIANSLVGVDVQKGSYKLKIQDFSQRIILNLSTLLYLLQGTPIGHPRNRNLDLQTIYVLIRAIIESCLTFSYIYILPATEEEGYFRHLVWEFADLQSMIRAGKSKIDADDNNPIRLITTKRHEYLKHELLNNEFFINLKKENKDNILKKSMSRYDTSWNKMAVDSGLKEETFRPIYNNLCSYAHSGNLSIITANLPDKLKYDLLSYNIVYLLIIFAKFIIDYCMVTTEANEKLSQDEELSDVLSYLMQSGAKKGVINKDKLTGQENV